MHVSQGIRHVLVALVVAALAGATAFGLIGPAVGPERIHSYDVVATIDADHDVTVREVIDWDFGRSSKRGIFRRIPHSGGEPLDITVSSPTAPDQARTTSVGNETEIRIGDPSTTISGRHRYVITYTLPETIVDGRFALNAVGDQWPVDSEDVHIAVLGADLAEPRCFTGRLGSTDRCDLQEVDGGYTVDLDRLDAHHAVTIDGDVLATHEVGQLPDPPPFEGRDDSARLRWALIVAGIGAATAVAVFAVCRQVGRNEVAEGGATEAAFVPYGTETFGPHHDAPSPPPPVGGTRLVADSRMAELAGLEFVPPGGVEPWQGAAVLREKVDDRTIGAWFSSLTAHDVIDFDDRRGQLVLSPGPQAATADPVTADILNRAMGGQGQIALGSYDPRFATAWSEVARLVEAWVVSSGVFRHRPPVRRGGASFSGLVPLLFCLAFPFASVASGLAAVTGLHSPVATVLLALVVPGVAALIAYLPLTRSLSARGSAIALRTESFRRFLADSEAQHVEWAWENGLLREYSAWAVALGEADAWNRALSSSSVPPPDQLTASHILVPHLYASSFHSAHTAPSSSGGGGGGGFSGGGFSGGGGGGGGGGSW